MLAEGGGANEEQKGGDCGGGRVDSVGDNLAGRQRREMAQRVTNEDIFAKLCTLEDSFVRMRGELHDLAAENAKLRAELKECKAETETAKQAARDEEKTELTTRAKLVELDQYGRKNNVRVFGHYRAICLRQQYRAIC